MIASTKQPNGGIYCLYAKNVQMILLSTPPRKEKFIIQSEPIPQQRHRDSKYGGKYDPNKHVKESIGLIALYQQSSKKKFTYGPLFMKISFYFPIPKYLKNKISENDWHIKRPDSSNLLKLYEDALKHMYKDDSQFCKIDIEKRYSSNPRTEIIITELE